MTTIEPPQCAHLSTQHPDDIREAVLEVTNLKVAYGSKTVVHDVSLTVRSGEIFGILGRNGAGKSTTISAITGQKEYRHGTVRILGQDITTDPKVGQQSVAVQPQKANLFPTLTALEVLTAWAAFYPNPNDPELLLQQLDLHDHAHKRVKTLSGGQAQRLLIATALIGGAPVIVLDEPSAGLDPHARQHVWDVLREYQRAGTTFVLTTHAMDEAEMLCDRLLLVHDGRVVDHGYPADLVNRHCTGSVITVQTAQAHELAQVLAAAQQHPSVTIREELPQKAVFSTTAASEFTALIAEIAPNSATSVRPHNIEDVFLSLTEKVGGPRGETR